MWTDRANNRGDWRGRGAADSSGAREFTSLLSRVLFYVFARFRRFDKLFWREYQPSLFRVRCFIASR